MGGGNCLLHIVSRTVEGRGGRRMKEVPPVGGVGFPSRSFPLSVCWRPGSPTVVPSSSVAERARCLRRDGVRREWVLCPGAGGGHLSSY
eukprot:GDKH01000579.1.p1 GENE.GDKH01000579.1~~GDKH01000579.1.p1  ORF type:complete len:89 (-),score=6.34 GDKH01000579.1:79-345(-)